MRTPHGVVNTASSAGRTIAVDVGRISGLEGETLVWTWYIIGGQQTASDYLGKLYLAAVRLGLFEGNTTRVLVYAPVDGDLDDTRTLLRDFVDNHGEAILGAVAPRTGT